MKVHHDGGDGVTDISKKHFAKHIKGVEPIEVLITRFGPFSFQVYGLDTKTREPVVILESGFNCGYGGTGPHGSVWALEQLGVPYDVAKVCFVQSQVLIDLRRPKPRIAG